MSLAAERPLIETQSSSARLATDEVRPFRALSLRLNFSWVLAGNLVRAACRFGMLVLLAHFCGLASAGRYALALAVCTPIWAIVMLGLRGALITDARGEYSFADYLAVRLAASVIGLSVVAGTILLGGCRADAAMVVLLVAFAKFFEGISDILHGRLQLHERMDRISIALVFQGVGGLTLMLCAGWLGGDSTWLVASFPVAMVLTLVFWDIPCCATVLRATGDGADSIHALWQQPLRWWTLGRLSIVAAPIAVAAFLIALIPQLPKYVIASVMGEEAVGLYAMITYWITLGMMVVGALGSVSAPRLAKYHAAGNVRAFVRLLGRLVGLVAGVGAVAVLAVAVLAPQIAAAIGHEGTETARLAVTLTLFAVALYITAPLGRALGAMRRFWLQTIAVGVGILVALLLLPWAVRNRGLVGAAEVMAISMAVVAILTAGFVWRQLACRARCEVPSPTEAAV